MSANTSYVSAGKPKIGGAFSVAATGTTLPTDASTALDNAFTNLGYISEDGLTEKMTRESEDVKAWGGDIVLSTQTEFGVKYSCTLIETLNVDVLKQVFGASNVTGTFAAGIAVNVKADELPEQSFVFDMVTRNSKKRIVIPKGKITEIGEVTYTDGDVTGYEITITAYPDATSNYVHQYILKNS